MDLARGRRLSARGWMRASCRPFAAMKREIDRALTARRGDGRASNVKLGPRRHPRDRVHRAGAPAPLRRRRSVAARAQLAQGASSGSPSAATWRPSSGRALSHALRAPAHRRAPAADPPRVPDPHAARATPARAGPPGPARSGSPGTPARRRPDLPAPATARITDAVHRAFREFFARAAGRRAAAAAAAEPDRRCGPPASPIPSARARTCGSSSRGGRWCRTPARFGAALERLYPVPARRALEEPRPRRGAEPVRALPVGGGTARRARRAARRRRRAAARAGATLRRRRSAHPAPDRPARAAGLAGRSRARSVGAGIARRAARGAGRRSSRPDTTPSERRDRLRRVKQAEELTDRLALPARRAPRSSATRAR